MPFLFVCRTKDRAIKKHDVWILKEESPRRIALVHRFLGTEFSIPRSSIVPGLRRASGVKCMDVTSFLDSLIVEEFPGIDDFLNLSPRRMKKESIGEWREYVMRRVANVAPLRRFDLSASGTNLLAFYTCKSICPGPVLWSIYLPDDEQARILTVWLNSSMNLLQILLNRSETRGAFIELGKYMLGAFEVVDPARLKEKEKRALLNTFSKQKDVTFTSLLEQLETSFEARKNIDKTVLKILGFDEEEISGLLAYLYPALYGEILRLKELMAG